MKRTTKMTLALVTSALLFTAVSDAFARRRPARPVRVVKHPVARHVWVRPIRPWVRRPYFGTIVAGVTLGTVIALTSEPSAPDPTLCWYWTNARHTHGYWDRCS